MINVSAPDRETTVCSNEKIRTDILDRQSRRESNARTYARNLGLVVARASGMIVTDIGGRNYYDCLSAAGTFALGHNHPAVIAAARQAFDDGIALQTLDLATPAKDAFVEALFETLPPGFAKRARIQFCSPSGTDAVEAALKLVRTQTRRNHMLTFSGGYHGMSQGSMALMGNTGPKRDLPALVSGAQFLPYPYEYRCPFGVGGGRTSDISISSLRAMLSDPESGFLPAGLIAEIVQGEGGVIPAPDGWAARVRQLTREHNVPMIVDEIQTGWGRTGKLYAFEHDGIEPDVLVLSKAIGGGLPLAVVLYDEHLDVWQPGAHTGTFRGNQLAMVTGLATLRVIQEQNVVLNAAKMGARLRGHLESLQQDVPHIGDVRGRGLMLGVEFIDPSAQRDELGRHPPAGQLARRVQKECLARSLIIEMGGRHGAVARFLPPLIITASQVDTIASIFADACRAAVSAGAGA